MPGAATSHAAAAVRGPCCGPVQCGQQSAPAVARAVQTRSSRRGATRQRMSRPPRRAPPVACCWPRSLKVDNRGTMQPRPRLAAAPATPPTYFAVLALPPALARLQGACYVATRWVSAFRASLPSRPAPPRSPWHLRLSFPCSRGRCPTVALAAGVHRSGAAGHGSGLRCAARPPALMHLSPCTGHGPPRLAQQLARLLAGRACGEAFPIVLWPLGRRFRT